MPGLPDNAAGLPAANTSPVPASADARPTLPTAASAAPADLAEAGAALNVDLDRFSSGPQRLPVTGVAAFGVAQLLRFGAGNAPLHNVTSAESIRTAVDATLSPASA